jgi:1-pyrroline-5-carboxylate dehydrogenase
MDLGRQIPPYPRNEPALSYAPGTQERGWLAGELAAVAARPVEIPVVIGGERIFTGDRVPLRVPHDHTASLGTYHRADGALALEAAQAALQARESWAATPVEHRTAIFLKAAELLSCRYRARVNAVAMLSLSKTAHQAEIDAVCELADFFRFNVQFMHEIYGMQPGNAQNSWNRMEWRPLEGFIFAVTPFNFASIAGNLPTSPALMGNTVLWKPASSAVYTAYWLMKLFEEAGFPPGVINFVPGSGSKVGNPVMASPHLAGVHFTGSTPVFQGMWRTIGENIAGYRTYPRIVGETGGKDFVFAHASADLAALATALVRGAFEYQGQKCSAASRAYVPRSAWPKLRDMLVGQISEIRIGSPTDFRNFMCAVIDQGAFDDITGYIQHAKDSSDAEILTGGTWDASEGYYIQPTVVVTSNPRFKLMEEEIFGPVLTIYVYDDADLDGALELCDTTSPYALTGAIFAQDRAAAITMANRLRHAAGNFYLNDKPTGAVVGQQPFGGSRASGTNDKAGSYLNLIRWTSQRTVKETFVPPRHFAYPFMDEE